ncbi:MAG: hypothetical protein QXQ66_00005, partial [Candidatus Hadarchaeum sp.]|uniref:hypothetical protein n=1 Tax=Candidatus Hadarchaeum sp. TaxID=2883567 RepID=UPI0031724259
MTDVVTAINIGIFLVNLLLITLVYKQVRFIYKPLITTKVLSYEKVTSSEKTVESKPSVMEVGTLYLVVTNVSKNSASNLKIRYELSMDGQKLIEEDKFLEYLNPNEATEILVNFGKLMKEHSELFDIKQVGNVEKTIPKKTLRLMLNVVVTWGFFLKHKMKDSYEIEWGSLESY